MLSRCEHLQDLGNTKVIALALLSSLIVTGCSNDNNAPINTVPPDTEIPDPSDPVYVPTDAYDYVNLLRQSAGLSLLSANEQLESAADNHARYLLTNNAQGHIQTLGLDGFSGITPADRANSAGYLSRDVAEGIAEQDSIQSAIDGLFSAIYHRLTLLNFEYDEIGISYVPSLSSSTTTSNGVLVHNMANSFKNNLCGGQSFTGNGNYYTSTCLENSFRINAEIYDNVAATNQQKNPTIITWPASNGIDISPVFFEETPDPLPDYGVSGYPVSVQFNPSQVQTVTLNSFMLFDNSGAEISPTRLLGTHSNINPGDLLSPLEFALFPLERLDWNSTYRAEVNYTINGESAASKSWQFTTRKLAYPLVKVAAETTRLNIKNTISTAFYFVPNSPFDTIQSVATRFPEGMIVAFEFIDANTLLFSISGTSQQQVNLTLNMNSSSSRQFDITIY